MATIGLDKLFYAPLQRMKMKRKPTVLRCSSQKRVLWSSLQNLQKQCCMRMTELHRSSRNSIPAH